jgi:hypothetical protein
VPAPPGTVPASAVVPDVEQTGSLTPLLDRLLFHPDIAQSSPSRQGFDTLAGQAAQPAQPAQPSQPLNARPAQSGSVTQAAIRRMWQRGGNP